MRWGTIMLEDGTKSAALMKDAGVVAVAEVNRRFNRALPTLLEDIIRMGLASFIAEEIQKFGPEAITMTEDAVRVLAPMRQPERIVGIGLNYRAHASDLDEQVPEEPATFLKPTSSIIGPGEAIVIPRVSERTTAEAEVALVFGRTARDVPRAAWRDVIFGVVPVLDMTTEDILRKNPRFLTRSKGFDSFFSFGPWIATLDEFPELDPLRVNTVVNGGVKAQNQVSGMVYSLADLVEFITAGTTVGATAVLTTGTPGAAVIVPGDTVEARIEGMGALVNPVEASR